MKEITNAIQKNVPIPFSNMVEGIRMEEEEDDDDEVPERENTNWQRILAVSSLVFALILVGGAIYLHIKEQQLEEPQLAYQTKSFAGIGIPVAIAIERKIPRMPYQTETYRHTFLYNIYYNNNNNNNNKNNNQITIGAKNNNEDSSLLCKEVIMNNSAVEVANNNNNKVVTITASAIWKTGSIAAEKVTTILQTV